VVGFAVYCVGMKQRKMDHKLAIYQAKSGAIELRADNKLETLWASQAQIADIFQVERSVVTKHVGNILKDKEVDQKSSVQKMHIANSDKPVIFYSLDIILAVGYRTNSSRAIEFRKWATKTLKEHIVKGFTINRSRIKENYSEFLKVVEDIRELLPKGDEVIIDNENVLELIKLFADTWLSLDAYDKERLIAKGATKKKVSLTANQLQISLNELKLVLMNKGEATELFGTERETGSIQGIVGNVMQSFGGKDVYPTVEEKAAHLLYFVVKNHPFVDGNKRSGAYAFIWFLSRTKLLDRSRMTPPALTAVTLLIAESHPKQKEKMIGLVVTMLSFNKRR